MLRIVGEEPVFRTGLLLAGDVDSVHVRRQLGRWVKAGKVYQLRRGLYALAPPYPVELPVHIRLSQRAPGPRVQRHHL